MNRLREHWEGACLSGQYTLEQWSGDDDGEAFFQTSLPDGRRAVVKLMPEPAVDGAALLDLWHRIRQLRHPNLIELLDCGRADHAGQSALFAVFEGPDDTLAAALNRSPLDSREAREVLDAVLDALRYLHAQGLAAGALDPDHIVGVGESIKLSTGALRHADTSSAYREDVRLLGELWRQVLMPASPKSSEIAAHAADPDPLARWTLAEIGAALEDAPPLPITEPPAAAPIAVEPPMPAPVSEPPVAVPPTVYAPALSEAAGGPPIAMKTKKADREVRATRAAHEIGPSTVPPSHRSASEHATARRFPKWIFAAVAGAALLILGLSRPRAANVAAPSPVASASPPAETAAPAPTAAPHVAVPAAPKPSPAAGQEIWRVIAFTFRTRDAAAKKAQQLNQYHPGLNAAVFSPMDKGGYYLVSLGGRMTHDQAVRLQRSARGKGLPRDLYVQNYSE